MSGALADRRILITGAAKGIGLATAERFVKEGARVAALDRDGETLAALAGRFGASEFVPFRADVSDPASVETAVSNAASALGGLDPLSFVLGGGEDFALVATFPPEAQLPEGWTRVGEVGAGEGVTVDGQAYTGSTGHRHFG